MQTNRLYVLLNKYFERNQTAEERSELFEMLVTPENESVAKEWIDEAFKYKLPHEMDISTQKDILDAIVQIKPLHTRSNYPTPVHRVHFIKTAWFRYAAAIILFLGIGAYLYIYPFTQKDNIAKTEKLQDVPAPIINRATLTLANGQKVLLDSAKTGVLAVQGNTNIAKTINGQLVYDKQIANNDLQYNGLNVPRGSHVADIILSDGSRVFLNAASSIKYPVAFNNDERKIEITGEAYLEIAKDAKRKFIVVSRGVQTEVLGTQFNLNAYPDESATKVTLIEGKVKVSSNSESAIIKPGQQSEVNQNGKFKLNDDVNLSQITAWKKGLFMFNNTDLRSILKQVSRWYNVEIEYRETVEPRSFGGGLNRQSPLSQVVKIFESNGVPCRIEGAKLIIGK